VDLCPAVAVTEEALDQSPVGVTVARQDRPGRADPVHLLANIRLGQADAEGIRLVQPNHRVENVLAAKRSLQADSKNRLAKEPGEHAGLLGPVLLFEFPAGVCQGSAVGTEKLLADLVGVREVLEPQIRLVEALYLRVAIEDR